MATLPTPEESARAILAVFRAHNMRPGGALMAGQVNVQFLQNGGSATEYAAGLQYAAEKGWVKAPRPNAFELTDTGFAEM